MSGKTSTLSNPQYSIFDVAGPVMVGPSSSHTAGACKLGQIARALFHGTPNKVTFQLHGSFGTVYKGHATDKALLAGVMKWKTSDDRMKNAFKEAKKNKLKYEYIIKDLGGMHHPNTVKIKLVKKGRKPMTMIGSSIGGGVVQVVKIDQFDVALHGVAGQFKTLVVWHENKEGVRTSLIKEIEGKKIRVHDIQTTRVGKKALTIINMDGRRLKLPEVLEMEKMTGINHVRSLTALENQ
jgi:L-serine dehydratase